MRSPAVAGAVGTAQRARAGPPGGVGRTSRATYAVVAQPDAGHATQRPPGLMTGVEARPASVRAGRGDRRSACHRAFAHPVGALPPARPRCDCRRRAGQSRWSPFRSKGLPTATCRTSKSCCAARCRPRVFDRLLSRCPRLRWVHSATAGVERVLTPAAVERGLLITNARGVFSEPIAEYVLMMILAISRRLPQLLELQRERTWQPLEANELADVTVGVVGLGSIGRRVEELRFGLRHARSSAVSSSSVARRTGRCAGQERLRRPGSATDRGHRGDVRRRDCCRRSSRARG